MTDADIKKYPELAWWMRLDLAYLYQKKPKIWRAFERATGAYNPYVNRGLWGGSAPWVLTWGFDPLIEVRHWACTPDGEPEPQPDGLIVQRNSIKRMGFTAPDGSLILIAADLVGWMFTPKGGRVFEATILHEMVHWCRFKIGKDVYDEAAPYAFEKAAYGQVVNRTWETCFSETYYKVTATK